MLMTRNSVMFHRRDDPLNEYRQLILYEDPTARSKWAVWEVISFISGPDTMKRSQRAHGSEYHMRKEFDKRDKELRDEGFVICAPENIPPKLLEQS